MAAERVCSGCGADLTGAHWKRKYCSERCRRITNYAGTCEGCGAATDGSNGKENAPTHCKDCAPRANAKWSRELIIEKINEWAVIYGQPPVSTDWNPASAEQANAARGAKVRQRFELRNWPTQAVVYYYWPTWNDAMVDAGF
jgi:hypothetical protein